jgi:hypothetical protein
MAFLPVRSPRTDLAAIVADQLKRAEAMQHCQPVSGIATDSTR